MPDIRGAGEGAADKGKGAITRKVGPLPLWGWAVAGVAAVVVVKKFTGGGGGSSSVGPGLVAIPSIGSGAPAGSVASGTPVVSPSQNVIGGADTAPGGTAPWWATAPAWWNATSGVPLPKPASTNGSAGAGPADTTPKGDTTPQASWFTKLLNPSGGMPAGASVTSIGGTVYSLSSDALARAGIVGAVPVANAAPATSTTSSAPTTGPYGSPLNSDGRPQNLNALDIERYKAIRARRLEDA